MRFSVDALLTYCVGVFTSVGLENADAVIASQSLVEADMRGVSSHGVTRLRTYAKRLETGVIQKNVKPQIVRDNGSTLLVDGNNGIGSVIGLRTMELCMQHADKVGSCFAAVSNSNHFGIGAFFTQPFAKKGYVALAMSNATASVVPFGGAVPMIGTNPLSIAIPTGTDMPLVIDMATSVVAQGKIIQAKKEGKPIPKGWAVDSNGNDTTNPEDALAGSMLPFGGPKGYAIGLFIQILCSVFSGAHTDKDIPSFWNDFEHPQNLGNFFGLIKLDGFQSPDVFYRRLEGLTQAIRQSRPAPGTDSVLLPGEIEYTKHNHAQQHGVDLSDAIVKDILDVGNTYRVDTRILTDGVVV